MYPLMCAGGYPVPVKDGILEIVGVSATPLTLSSTMKVLLRDDVGNNSPDYVADPLKNEIVHLESTGLGTLSVTFNPPLKTRKGLDATYLTNAVCQVYVR